MSEGREKRVRCMLCVDNSVLLVETGVSHAQHECLIQVALFKGMVCGHMLSRCQG